MFCQLCRQVSSKIIVLSMVVCPRGWWSGTTGIAIQPLVLTLVSQHGYMSDHSSLSQLSNELAEWKRWRRTPKPM